MTLEAYYRDPAVEAVVEARTGFSSRRPMVGTPLPPFDPGAAGPRARPASPPPLHVTQVADVLVVGGGAAGAALAWRLSQHGADVLGPRAGRLGPRRRHPQAPRRLAGARAALLEPERGPARMAGRLPVRNLGANPVDAFVYSAVGGSATGWGGAFWRFLPSDFRGATLDGFGRDWPIGYEDLERYYEINEAEMGMSGIAGDPTAPPTPEAPLPPVSMGAMGERWIDGFERLGWYWWVQHQAIASRDYRGRPRARTTGTARTAARPARWRRPRTRTGPRRCATACGCRRARGSARSPSTPAGARTACSTTRPTARCSARPPPWSCSPATGWERRGCCSCRRRPPSPTGWRTPAAWSAATSWSTCRRRSSGTSRSARAPTTGRGARRRRRGTSTRPTRPATSSAGSSSRRCAGSTRSTPRCRRRAGARGTTRRWSTTSTTRRVCWVCGDDEPEPHNRVELDHERVDGFGLPGVVTHYTLSENSRRIGEAGIEKATELCHAAGADSVRVLGFDTLLGWHLLGTARMGAGPRRLRRRRLAPLPRRPEPARRRRVGDGDGSVRQPDPHGAGARAARGGRDLGAPAGRVRLVTSNCAGIGEPLATRCRPIREAQPKPSATSTSRRSATGSAPCRTTRRRSPGTGSSPRARGRSPSG